MKKMFKKVFLFLFAALLMVSHLVPTRVLAESAEGEEDSYMEFVEAESKKELAETKEVSLNEFVSKEEKKEKEAKDYIGEIGNISDKFPGGTIIGPVINEVLPNEDGELEIPGKLDYLVQESDGNYVVTLSLPKIETEFSGMELSINGKTNLVVEGEKYEAHLNFSYSDSEGKEAVPFHAGSYIASWANDSKVFDADGKEVSNIIINAGSLDMIIKPRSVIAQIYCEKNRYINDGKMHSAGYYIEGINGNLEDEMYALQASEISYNGVDRVEISSGKKSITMFDGNFQCENPDYSVGYKFVNGDQIAVEVSYSSIVGVIHLDSYLTGQDVVYNGQVQQYETKINGQTGLVTLNLQAGNSIFEWNKLTYTVTFDTSKLIVSGKDAGVYFLVNEFNQAVVSAKSSDGFENKAALYFCIDHDIYANDKTKIAGRLLITAAPLNITVKDGIEKNYGEEDPDRLSWVEVEGLFEGDDLLDYVFIDREPGENVRRDEDGNIAGYEIIVGQLKQGTVEPGIPSEAVELKPVEGKIDSKEEEGSTTYYADNYILMKEARGYLYINPLPVTIKADYQEKFVGDKDPVLTYVVSELAGDEELPEGAVIIYREPGEEVGTYRIHLEIDYSKEPVVDDKEPINTGIDIIDNPIFVDADLVERLPELKLVEVREERRELREEVSNRAENLLMEFVKQEAKKEMFEEFEMIKKDEMGEISEKDPIIIDQPIEDEEERQFSFNNYDITLVENDLVIKDNTPAPDPDPTPDPTPDPDPIVDPEPTVDPNPRPNPDPTPDPEPVVEPEPTVEPEPLPVESIEEDITPTTNGSAWALVNLLCVIAAFATSAGMIITMVKKSDEESDEEENKERKYSKLLGLIPAIAAAIVFALTEDMRLPMAIIDKWTLLMVAIAVITVVIAYLSRNNKEDKKNEQLAA